MNDEKVQNPEVEETANQETTQAQAGEEQATDNESAGEDTNSDTTEEASIITEPEVRIVEENIDYKDKYIRLSAEFDNYRKRSVKERMDTIKSASAALLEKLLPIADNFERALKATETAPDVASVAAGIKLIHTSLLEVFKGQGLKEIEALHQVFDVDKHEALTQIPAPSDDLKGKVVDVIEKGYILNDKIVRYAKVVLGQ
jgi:molecular chaperone GrpE